MLLLLAVAAGRVLVEGGHCRKKVLQGMLTEESGSGQSRRRVSTCSATSEIRGADLARSMGVWDLGTGDQVVAQGMRIGLKNTSGCHGLRRPYPAECAWSEDTVCNVQTEQLIESYLKQ